MARPKPEDRRGPWRFSLNADQPQDEGLRPVGAPFLRIRTIPTGACRDYTTPHCYARSGSFDCKTQSASSALSDPSSVVFSCDDVHAVLRRGTARHGIERQCNVQNAACSQNQPHVGAGLASLDFTDPAPADAHAPSQVLLAPAERSPTRSSTRPRSLTFSRTMALTFLDHHRRA